MFTGNPFGNLFGTDEGYQQFKQENADKFGISAEGDQAAMLANQDKAFADNATGVPNKPFDLAGLASDLFTASEEGKKRSSNPMSMATNLTPHQGAGVRMPQAPQPMAQPMQQQAMQQPQNTAMQAVTQGFGKVPRIQQILQTLGYGR